MRAPTAAEIADSIQQELIKSGKILSGDFARAFEEKNKQKILEIIIEHFIHHTQFIMSLHFFVCFDTANSMDDEIIYTASFITKVGGDEKAAV